MNVDYVRNLVARLRSEGIIESVSASAGFGFLGNRKDLAGRQMINVLAKPFDAVLHENESEFLKWAKIVLGTPSREDLLRKVEALKKERKGSARG